MSAVFPREFGLIGILKKFIKGFGLLLLGKAQHIGLSTIFVWIFEFRQSVLESLGQSILVYRHFLPGYLLRLCSLLSRICFMGIYPSFLKGLIYYYLVERSILVCYYLEEHSILV